MPGNTKHLENKRVLNIEEVEAAREKLQEWVDGQVSSREGLFIRIGSGIGLSQPPSEGFAITLLVNTVGPTDPATLERITKKLPTSFEGVPVNIQVDDQFITTR